jgi:hypothetical protein
MKTPTSGDQTPQYNEVRQPVSRTDAPAARYMLLVVLGMLIGLTIIAVVIYKHYTKNDVRQPDNTEQAAPPLVP